jgi:hypothetical protein
VFVGADAGRDTVGDNNTAIGDSSGRNVTGNNNAALGSNSGNRLGMFTMPNPDYDPEDPNSPETIQVGSEGNSVVGANSGNDIAGRGNSAHGSGTGNNVYGDNNSAFGSGSGNNIGWQTYTNDENEVVPGQRFSNNAVVGNGSGNNIAGNNNSAFGANAGNNVTGDNNIAMGTDAGNGVSANNTISIGNSSKANADNALAIGTQSGATGERSIAIGTNAQANGDSSMALGRGAQGNGADSVALGRGAQANGNGSLAFGRGARAEGDGSVAIGRDSAGGAAVATMPNEFALGTARHTYTAAGITSLESRQRQQGPLEVVTSDANGHLATDGGLLFEELSKLGGGVAIAMALENPDLVGNERFGLAGNVAFWEGNVALGFTAMGVLGQNFLGAGERWALSGGVGFTIKEESYGGRSSQSSVGGRAGLQITW